MKRIQEIIKEAAERYGFGYNEEQDNPKIKLKDGTIKDFDISDLNNIINENNIK